MLTIIANDCSRFEISAFPHLADGDAKGVFGDHGRFAIFPKRIL
jgi:hypothetical protein